MGAERANLPENLHDAVFHYRRGSEWHFQGRYEEALFNFSEVIRLGEMDEATRQTAEFPWALLNRGSILHSRGRYERALADYQRAIAVAPEIPWTHDALAWLLATCPDAKYRDGKRAVEIATKGCELSAWGCHQIIDTLAAALAECSDFPAAVKRQTEALDRAPQAEYASYLRRLELYRSGRPLRAKGRSKK